MSAASKAAGRLGAAERCFELRLREARLEQGEAERQLERRRDASEALEREAAGLERYRGELVARAAVLDAAHLSQVDRYRSWLAARLDEQRGAVEAAEAEWVAKREVTRSRFEEIAVVRRVLERRGRAFVQEQARQAQRAVDALSALKLSSEILRDADD